MNKFDFLLPTPQNITDGGNEFAFDGFDVQMPPCGRVGNTAAALVRSLGEGSYPVIFTYGDAEGDEGYILDITPDKTAVTAKTDKGFYYGVVTLAKLLEHRGQNILPVCKIKDHPDFPDRGLMLENRYGSDFMTLDDYKKAIDYLSAMKYNQLTVGVYGCWCIQYDMRLSEFLYLPIKSHPELKTPRDIRYYSVKEEKYIEKEDVLPTIFEEDYFGDLIKYAADHAVKIKPLFNSLGHNTLIPRLHPELSAKDENGNPTGHGFCVSDDAVYDYMFSIYDEIIDRYLKPNGLDSIEIGLDEVYAWLGEDLGDIYGRFDPYCKCEKCRGMERKELMLRYIIRVCKYLVGKGMKSIYIYHDMLFEQFDIVNEELVRRFKDEGIYDAVVLDWWYYTKEEDVFQKREINSLFRSIAKPFTGYYHWVLPMEYNDNIRALGRLAKKHGFEGIESYSAFEYCFDRPFMWQAEISWNSARTENYDEFLASYAASRFPEKAEEAKEVLDIMGSITVNDREPNLMNGLEYYWYTYTAENEPYPRNFHGAVYKKIDAEREKYVPYFTSVKEKAAKVLDFFTANVKENAPDDPAAVWYAIALHYYTYASNYLAMLEAHDAYEKGEADADAVIAALGEMLNKQEKLMLTLESTRIAANSFVYLRNHSITRQLYVDLIAYFGNTSKRGGKPTFGIYDFSYCISERYKKLR